MRPCRIRSARNVIYNLYSYRHILSFFKLGFYSLAFIVNSLKTTLNTGQKGYIYREVLESFCYIKVLRVFWTTPNCLGGVGVRGIEEVSKCFTCIY
jgi:hypothetical protein